MRVTADLRNAGSRTADEVAQLYIHQRCGTAARPVRQLKGFQRVTLKAGERRRLAFTLPAQSLGDRNSAAHGWVQDASPSDIWIGGS